MIRESVANAIFWAIRAGAPAAAAETMTPTPTGGVDPAPVRIGRGLRVDYLRPAISSHFEPAAEVLRLDSRVATLRMEFRDAESRLLSTGSAACIVS